MSLSDLTDLGSLSIFKHFKMMVFSIPFVFGWGALQCHVRHAPIRGHFSEVGSLFLLCGPGLELGSLGLAGGAFMHYTILLDKKLLSSSA